MPISSKKTQPRKTPPESMSVPSRMGAVAKSKIPWTHSSRAHPSIPVDMSTKNTLKRNVPSKTNIDKTERIKGMVGGTKKKVAQCQQQAKDQTQTNRKIIKEVVQKNVIYRKELEKKQNTASSNEYGTNYNTPTIHTPGMTPIIIDPKLIKSALESKQKFVSHKSLLRGEKSSGHGKNLDNIPTVIISPQPLPSGLPNPKHSEQGVKPMGCMYEITVEEHMNNKSKRHPNGEDRSSKVCRTTPGNVILLSSPDDVEPGPGTVRYIPAAILLMDPREYSSEFSSEPCSLQDISHVRSDTSMGDSIAPTKYSTCLEPETISQDIGQKQSRKFTGTSTSSEGNNNTKESEFHVVKQTPHTKKEDRISGEEGRYPNKNEKVDTHKIDDVSTTMLEDSQEIQNTVLQADEINEPNFHMLLSETPGQSKCDILSPDVLDPRQKRTNTNEHFRPEAFKVANRSLASDVTIPYKSKENYVPSRFITVESNPKTLQKNEQQSCKDPLIKATDELNSAPYSTLYNLTRPVFDMGTVMASGELPKDDTMLARVLSRIIQCKQLEDQCKNSTSKLLPKLIPSRQQTEHNSDSKSTSQSLPFGAEKNEYPPIEVTLLKNFGYNDDCCHKMTQRALTCHFDRTSGRQNFDKNSDYYWKQKVSGADTMIPIEFSGRHFFPFPAKDKLGEYKEKSITSQGNGLTPNNPRSIGIPNQTIPVYHMRQISFTNPWTKSIAEESRRYQQNSDNNAESSALMPQEPPALLKQNSDDLVYLRAVSSDTVAMNWSRDRKGQFKDIIRSERQTSGASKRKEYQCSQPIVCPDSLCGSLISSMTMLPHFNRDHAQVPFVLVHASRKISISVKPSEIPANKPKIVAFFHVIEHMSSGPFVLMVATQQGSAGSGPGVSLLAWLVELDAASQCTVRVLRRSEARGAVSLAAAYSGPTVSLRESQGLSSVLGSGRYALVNPWLLQAMEQPEKDTVEVTAVVHEDAVS